MKIRSIELTNFRKFVGTVRVENIGDNVNVLVGRNELGKSTLLEAINGVIFEKAKSAAGHVKAFRHFVNGTVPEVKLAFDIDGKTWTIHKRFAGQPATINSIPTARVACRSKNGGRNSQREIHHGTTPASTQGTNTKKMAVPMTAAALRMDTIRSLLISNHIALMSQSGHSRRFDPPPTTSGVPR
jgi:ABC-type cobalamin/Fe3+-siderophores transport system ATPase subunit